MTAVPKRRSPDPRAIRTRAAILDAAGELFTEQGFEATSVATIAERARVGISSIYLHFSSKSELIDELVGDALARHSASFAPGDGESPPLESIHRLGEAYLDFAAAEPAAARALSLVAMEPHAAGAHARDFLEGLVDQFEQQVRALVGNGKLPRESIHAATALVLGTVVGLVDQVGRRDALAIQPEVARSALRLGTIWAGTALGLAAVQADSIEPPAAE